MTETRPTEERGKVEAVIAIDAERVRSAIDRTDSLPEAADDLIRSMKRTVENLHPSIVRRLNEIEESR